MSTPPKFREKQAAHVLFASNVNELSSARKMPRQSLCVGFESGHQMFSSACWLQRLSSVMDYFLSSSAPFHGKLFAVKGLLGDRLMVLPSEMNIVLRDGSICAMSSVSSGPHEFTIGLGHPFQRKGRFQDLGRRTFSCRRLFQYRAVRANPE